MLLSDFDYSLPSEAIAQHPPQERGQSRLMVIPRAGGPFEHRMFVDLPEYLREGDCLVLNDTRVIPARLIGRRSTGGQVELLLLRPVGDREWETLARPARRLRVGEKVEFGDVLTAEVSAEGEEGLRTVRLEFDGELLPVLDKVGRMPLPPYIHRPEQQAEDKTRYQTVYARTPGAVAAPTAGLHFTPELLQKVRERGVQVAYLTLHVGLGTFRPIQVERLEDHVMHAEWYHLSEEAAATISTARTNGGRVIAVGTTVVRTLESVADEQGRVHPAEAMTSIFIKPGFDFRVTDGMLTNFHLPKSSLLVMIAAFVGRERILAAYAEAIEKGYRFYSYGDATLII